VASGTTLRRAIWPINWLYGVRSWGSVSDALTHYTNL
jgi:hypothetical protein